MNGDHSHIRILFVGGGSGGHFYPLIATAEALRVVAPSAQLSYAGPNPYDTESLERLGISFIKIPSGKQRRYRSFSNILDLFKVFFGCIVAITKLYILYPDVIMSKGSYTSVPIIIAARFLRIPILLHESDAVMGRANKLALTRARDVVINYPELAQNLNHPRIHALGIPTRTILKQPKSSLAHKNLGISIEKSVILIIGGSQGAERINDLVLNSLDELLPFYTIIHQTGAQHLETCVLSAQNLIVDTELRKGYHPFAFMNVELLNDAYHTADIIVSRAGSTSIYEIALHGKPSILIPIPEEVSHDQRTNAYTYARTGAATVIEESNLVPGLLRSEIDRIMQDTGLKNEMSRFAQAFGKTDAAEQISSLILKIAKEH